MAVVTIKSGVLNDDTGVLRNVPSPIPPYNKGHGEYCQELKVGTDFTSGDDVVITFEGSDTLLYVHAVNDVGATVPFVEADVTGVATGRKVTFSAVTTNIKVVVKYSI